MSVIEKTANEIIVNAPVKEKSGDSLFASFVKLLSSVRLGIILLIALGLLCFLGMIIVQQNVEGFESYFASLTPAQKLVYGSLDLFDIYHAWYFNALLLLLSFNIVLSSIDRFPKTWKLISRPRLQATPKWLRHQEHNDSFEMTGASPAAVAETIAERAKSAGWRKVVVTEKDGKSYIFAQSGAWNRLGAYAVHVGLLTIFLGGFMTGQLGNTGNMALQPGQASNEIYEFVSDLDKLNQVTKQLPFEIICTDIQQKLIKDDGSISASNTIDWITRFQIRDETGVTEAVAQMNRPFDYRGYRFFQASFVATGKARHVNVRLTPANGGAPQDVTIPRNGTINLADGTQIRFVDFRGNFSLGKENPDEDTSGYPNPAAVLQVTPAGGGTTQTAYAFNEKMANIPVAQKAIAGYTYRLTSFEKVPDQHVLSIQRDPGATVVYVGFIILTLTLIAVFFFSHQRVWALIERVADDQYQVTVGGSTNRNQAAFGEKFRRFSSSFGNRKTGEAQI